MIIKITVFYFCLTSFAFAKEPKVSWSGDIRVRGQTETNLPGDDRASQKIRARLGLKTDIDENLKAEIRIATSKANNSTNQTLGDNKEPGMSRRFIGLDLAYANWKVVEAINFQFGRVPQAHYKPGASQLVLDSDLALEGATVLTDVLLAPDWKFRSSWGSAWIRENYDTYYSEKKPDNMLNWGQVSLQWRPELFTINFGAGFFNFNAIQNTKFSDISVGGSSRGNSQNPDASFKNNYIPRQYFIDASLKFEKWNFGVFSEWIVNGETVDPNKGYYGGFSVGEEKWTSQVAYVDLNSDAVPGVFTDSDFAGGSTDSRGYMASFNWKVMKKMSLGVLHIWSNKRTELGDTAYDRTHLDLTASF